MCLGSFCYQPVNARGAAAVKDDIAQPALSKISLKNYWSLLHISLNINNSPLIEPRTVAKNETIIEKALPI